VDRKRLPGNRRGIKVLNRIPKKGKSLKMKKKIAKKIGLSVLVVCLIAGIILLFIYIPSFKKAIILATSVQPETLTELYFEDHLSLPEKVVLSDENGFKFTIHNLEDKDIEYTYSVYIEIDGEKDIIIDSSSILIKNNEFQTITESFALTTPVGRARVIVELINKDQYISFWIEEE